MLRHPFSICAALAALLFPAAADEITFGALQAQPGQKVRLLSRVEGTHGTVKREQDGTVVNGSIDFARSRELTWTFRAPAADGTRRGMARIVSMNTEATSRMAGQEDKTAEQSPLNGKIISFSKPPQGDWSFELDGSLRTLRIEKEIRDLTHYLKRDWFPDHPVRIGDSWEFDPVWIKMIVERDLQNAQTIGTMQLRQIRHSAQGRTALVSITIESTGGDFQADGSESSAAVDLKGEATIHLTTMLEEQLTLRGSIRTRTGTVGAFTTTEVPIHISVTKSFTRD
jgi:hypothetical protein